MFLRMPPFLRFLKLFLMIISVWSDNLLATAQFTIPGGVHYHWHWDEQDQKIIRRVYESHENYTFTAYKFPEPDYTAQYVFIAFVTFCSLASFVCFGLIVYEVTRMDKDKQETQQQPKSNGDYAFFVNRDITLQQKLGSGKFGSVWRAVVEPKVDDPSSPFSSSSEQQQQQLQPLQGSQSSPPPTSNTSNTCIKKDVAVKVFTGKDERSLSMERFIYDLPGMAHPNLLRYLAAFELRPYEHLPSEDSKKKKRTKERENQNIPPPSNRTFWLVTDCSSLVHGLASGLSFLHNFGDYHHQGRQGMSSIALRDFKSANIILAVDGNGSLRPLIADLGLAVVFSSGGEAFGQALERVGTPRYMAPEVLSGHLDLTTPAAYLAVDMYALGLVLWELLSRTEVEEEEETEEFESYRPPYQEYFREDGGGEGRRAPSVAEMHSLVVGRRLRPSVKSGWFGRNSRGGGVQVVVVAESMVDCWDVDGEARLKAATLLMRMEAILNEKGSSKEEEKEVENEVFEV
ncbi:Activin receptor type-2A [Tyrophagus putrescentiae]|nr:Activin receptor type-2A [Tyrophagus putrescentiae]